MKNIYDETLLRRLYVDEHMSVEDISAQTGHTLRGLRSKLGSMGVYRKKTYVSKSGLSPVRKRVLIDKLIPILQITAEEGDSLEKIKKRVLQKLVDILEKMPVDQNDK